MRRQNGPQADILDAAREVAQRICAQVGGIGRNTEDAHYRPAIVNALRARGFQTGEIRWYETSARAHPYDIVWERDGVHGAIELKLPARTAPIDDARLLFRYDLRWLELGLAAGHFTQATAILLTSLRGLYDEPVGADWRHDYYRIGHRAVHRCTADGPDHLFERTYPGTKFKSPLFPLRLDGCYDFRKRWTVVEQPGATLYQLVVPVVAARAT